MFELVQFQKFRDTPSVQFFDITVPSSNARDLVCHTGPAISPNNAEDSSWQFYLHPRQEDNLLALSGGRTFHLINFEWDCPYHVVRLDANRHILRIPPGTFHRSESDPKGSMVINQAVRTKHAKLTNEFRVYNSGVIPKLKALLSSGVQPMYHGFEVEYLRAA
ncbi:MAG: hypothetical protein HLUCCA11_14515 [Phormidesmis priestleyi Ana]|uniref:Redox protein n=1 Tax=Phormidesmis priestleyi Ana TaxID=1666911 RepID=A0A0P8BL90_9CYAN|nr:MAG: hypothetical protein HLUCCA11_14515 [Phormidesmis priestleyi Ana]